MRQSAEVGVAAGERVTPRGSAASGLCSDVHAACTLAKAQLEIQLQQSEHQLAQVGGGPPCGGGG